MKGYDKSYFEDRDLLIPHLAATIKNIAKIHQLETILDVGCGTGRLIQYLAKVGFKVAGCDIAKVAVIAARLKNPGIKIMKASATKLPYADNSFDLVCAISVIEHLTAAQTDKFLAQTSRVLKSHGFVFLVTPNFATPLKILQGQKWFGYSDPTHITFYSPRSLSAILTQFGFSNIQKNFPIKYTSSLEWEFPPLLSKLPTALKQIIIYLIFATPLSVIRNSTWILAQKNEEN